MKSAIIWPKLWQNQAFGQLTLLLALLYSSCSPNYTSLSRSPRYTQNQPSNHPNYSELTYWAAHPQIHDPSDSVPQPLIALQKSEQPIDVFFIHPTTYTDKEARPWNAPLNDAALNAKTDYSSILYQASIFNNGAKVYAPRYRQAHLRSYFPVTKADTLSALAAFDTAFADVEAAFLNYLKLWNEGRPFIIAAHSQGTTHAKALLKKYVEGKPLQEQLVVAYIVGIPVEEDYFSSLKPCSTATETGCFVGWRTYRNGYKPNYVAAEKKKIWVTNPISWSIEPEKMSRKEQKGAVVQNFNKIYKRVADAYNVDNVLFTRHPRFFGSFLLRTKNYHVGDFNLYYLDVRENMQQRVSSFLGTKKAG